MLKDKPMNNVPCDWENPNFEFKTTKPVHEWKSYVDDEVSSIWNSFNDEQKQALAQNFQNIADNEDWD